MNHPPSHSVDGPLLRFAGERVGVAAPSPKSQTRYLNVCIIVYSVVVMVLYAFEARAILKLF